MIDQVPGGYFSHFMTRIIDSSEIGLYNRGYGVVVEAYEGDIFRDSVAGLFQRQHATDGTVIIRNKNSIGQGLHIGYNGSGPIACFLAQVADNHEFIFERNSMVLQGLFITKETIDINVPFRCGGNMDDLLATA